MGGFLSKMNNRTNGASAVAVVAAQIAANPDPVDVALSEISRDPGKFLFRQKIVEGQVAKLQKILEDGLELDPVDLFRIDGTLWLVHGHHREQAHRSAGRSTIKAVIRQGTIMDALEFAWRANGGHGEKLTDADNILKVASILQHKPAMSDTEIAKLISTSVSFVGDARKQLESKGAIQKPTDENGNEIRMVTRNGKTYAQKVGGIGKSKPAKKPNPVSVIEHLSDANLDHHRNGIDGKIAKSIRLTADQWTEFKVMLEGSEIGRVVLEQIEK